MTTIAHSRPTDLPLIGFLASPMGLISLAVLAVLAGLVAAIATWGAVVLTLLALALVPVMFALILMVTLP